MINWASSGISGRETQVTTPSPSRLQASSDPQAALDRTPAGATPPGTGRKVGEGRHSGDLFQRSDSSSRTPPARSGGRQEREPSRSDGGGRTTDAVRDGGRAAPEPSGTEYRAAGFDETCTGSRRRRPYN